MMGSSVGARRGRISALVGLLGVTAAVVVALSSPAEARRRSNKRPAYAPPYAAMVVDVKSGRTLHAQNEDAPRHPASITKVMTLYLLFEQMEKGQLKLDSELRVSARAAIQAPSKLGLKPGSTIDVEDAIKALVTKSANDVAVVIAENIGGNEDAFADMMTRKARALGMSRTTFTNASGLPDPEQVTTARDLTVLARAIQDRFPRYYPYFSTRLFRYAGGAHRNHNRLLGRVEGVDGIKTGYTRMSGFNLMTSARTDNRHIVAVVMGGRSGPSRDAIVASLVRDNLPRAFAGNRTSPASVEVAVAEQRPKAVEPDPASAPPVPIAAARPSVVKIEPVPVAPPPASIAKAEPAPAAAPKPSVEIVNVRPVVASAAGSLSTTTPSAFRWIVGAQPVPPAAGGPAPAGQAGGGTRSLAYAPEQRTIEAKPAETKTVEARSVRQPETALAKTEPKADETIDTRPTGSTGWVIQLGATEDEAKAKEILTLAKDSAKLLSKAAPFTEKVTKGGTTLWRARFSGFDTDSAQAACRTLKRSGFSCFATRG